MAAYIIETFYILVCMYFIEVMMIAVGIQIESNWIFALLISFCLPLYCFVVNYRELRLKKSKSMDVMLMHILFLVVTNILV